MRVLYTKIINFKIQTKKLLFLLCEYNFIQSVNILQRIVNIYKI